jgi:glucokinase
MSILGIDLGGSKLAAALFSESGELRTKESISLGKRKGGEIGQLIEDLIRKYQALSDIKSIGVSVPGISRHKTGTVWAPNLEGWEDYPLLKQIREISGPTTIGIESDRVCSILGEQWQGRAKDCRDAIFLAVGTGIGAGILVDGNVLRGSNDIAGAIGWLALSKPFQTKYISTGCFEFYASGPGIPKLAREVLASDPTGSILRIYPTEKITTRLVFDAYDEEDPVADMIVRECILYWGMAAANLVSIFNPEKIIFGGGVFGPAAKLIQAIREEAAKWAQPISMTQVTFEHSMLEGDAAVYGAGFLALQNNNLH